MPKLIRKESCSILGEREWWQLANDFVAAVMKGENTNSILIIKNGDDVTDYIYWRLRAKNTSNVRKFWWLTKSEKDRFLIECCQGLSADLVDEIDKVCENF